MRNLVLMRGRTALLALFFLLPGVSIATPADTVEKLHIALMQSSLNQNLTERVEALRPVVEQTYNFPAIARLVTGRHWRKFDEQQQARFVEVFTELSIVTYAERFVNMGASKFSPLDVQEQPRNSKKVTTSLALDSNSSFAPLSDKSDLGFEYILQVNRNSELAENNWQIINVIVDGISDLALKRSNYVNTLNQKGFDALIEQLNKNIADVQEE